MRRHIQRLRLIVWSIGILLCFNSSEIVAQEIRVVFPSNLPPWTLQNRNAGITVDIVRSILHLIGYQLSAEYLPLKELNSRLGDNVDAHAQVESVNLTGFYSEDLVEFQTSLISLAPNQIRIRTIRDLQSRSLVAFSNASHIFSAAFQKMAQTNSAYQEMTDQEQQIVLLYNGQADVILIDKSVFLYFRRITSLTNTSMPITFHQISGLTEKSPTFVVFKEKHLRDRFNQGLRQLKKEGGYYETFYKYVR